MVKTYISILRGINVSGQKKIRMADLKALYEKLSFKDVQTYIQSGNVIFKSELSDKSKIKNKIETKISEQYGFEVPVLVLTEDEICSVFSNNQYIINRNEDISLLHVTFLETEPKAEQISEILKIQSSPDEFIVKGKAIYLFCPNGYGKTKLNNTFFEKKLKTAATTRNWKTISKLTELLN